LTPGAEDRERLAGGVDDVAGGRVELAQLSITAAKLAELQPAKTDEGEAAKAFTALNKAGVIGAALCRKLRRAQKARTMIEHSYVKVPAGKVHEAAELIAVSAREFIGPYRAWVEDYL
jgi:uncharacterized protein YutE (UPF0331/DUF86 family)